VARSRRTGHVDGAAGDRLWDGETITESGRFYQLRDARLHTLARRKPPIWVSAFGPKAARVAGRWGDGLWTLPDPSSTPELIETFHSERGDERGEEKVSDDELAESVLVGSDVDAHIEGIRELLKLRPTCVVLQNNSPDPHRAIQVYGEEVLPALRSIHTAAPRR
jgi:coenzyme F420-dependent glucose-6-phosphate dehydrogenase